MKREDVLTKLQDIYKDVLDDETLHINDNIPHADIAEWDSLAQIDIITACEGEFDIKFDLRDIPDIKSVADLVDIVLRKKT